MDNLTFIERYEAVLKERRIKKGDFYKAVGITDSAVSQWRKGKTIPAMTTISAISDYLDIPMYFLIDDDADIKKATAQSESYGNRDSEIIELEDIIRELPDEKRKSALDYLRYLSRTD